VGRRHVRLPQLKALTARLSITAELAANLLSFEDIDARSLIGDIGSAIARIADIRAGDTGPLDVFLQSITKTAGPMLPGHATASPELSDRLSALDRALTNVNCERCAGGLGRICRDDPANDEPNLATGECIRMLHDLLHCIDERAKQIYSGATSVFPTIHLSTEETHRDQDADLYGKFNVSGFCEVLQEDPALTSFVVLCFKANAFNLKTMCSLPYILAHEVVCHAYQTLRAGKREIPDGKCLWSEAWMDRFAYELTERWLDDDQPSDPRSSTDRSSREIKTNRRFPDWAQTDKLDVKAQALLIHEFRYRPRSKLPAAQAQELNAARDAFRRLREHWSKRAPLERNRVTRFSALLNACDTTNEQRAEIVTRLGILLRGGNKAPVKMELAAHACSDFVQTGLVKDLLEELKKINKMTEGETQLTAAAGKAQSPES
jgi:hypothetical protein